ncbi:MAG: serine protease [Solobacterium sp.]|nr:serine protease [Solobacterium sp.]
MKRWVTAAVAVLLVWNVALTAALLGQADQRTDNGGITVVNHTINGYTTDVTGILRDVRPSLVTVRISEDEFEDTFSGAVYEVRDDGCYILTTASLLRESAVCSIRFDSGVELSGEIVGRDLLTDIALIRTHPDFEVKPVNAGDARYVQAGEYGVLAGSRSPESQSGPVSFGIISLPAQTLRRSHDTDDEWILSVFHTDAVMNHDLAGGLLLNLSGDMIGMVSGTLSSAVSGMTCAVSCEEIALVTGEMLQDGAVTRGYLGITGRNVSDLEVYQKNSMNISLDQTAGVVVTYVEPGSPAAHAGLMTGDILLGINEETVNDLTDLRRFLYAANPGDYAALQVRRQAETETLEAVLQ